MNKNSILNLVTKTANKANLAEFAKIKASIQEAEAIGIKFIEFTEAEKIKVNSWIKLAKSN
jgi:hypothetical protein